MSIERDGGCCQGRCIRGILAVLLWHWVTSYGHPYPWKMMPVFCILVIKAIFLNVQSYVWLLQRCFDSWKRALRICCDSVRGTHPLIRLQCSNQKKNSTCDQILMRHIPKIDLLLTEVFEACISWAMIERNHGVLTKKNVLTHLVDLFYEVPYFQSGIAGVSTFDVQYKSMANSVVEFSDWMWLKGGT